MENLSNEIWKPIMNYEGLYEVSNLGRVKSLDRMCESKLIGKFLKKGKIKNLQKRGEYLKVSLCKKGIINQVSVHRLVAECFIPNDQNKKCVNHKNGDKRDNKVDNLEWVSYSENTNHSYKMGLQIPKRGSEASQAKLTESQVLEIRKLAATQSRTEIAKKYNIGISTISQIINRRRWKHI